MKFLGGVLILSGMIIGIGMFGIPFSFVQSGFIIGSLELIILAGIVLLLHLLYADIVLATPGFHRFPGYVKEYCGWAAVFFSRASTLFGISGTLLAYLILGGIFLQTTAGAFGVVRSEFFWGIVVFIAGACITFFSSKYEAVINGMLTAVLIAFIFFLVGRLFPHINISYFEGVHIRNVFVPYGVLLFSLAGGAVIPDLITFLGHDRMRSRGAIMIGSLVPAVVYFFFAYAVVGVSGSRVSEEAIRGLEPVLGPDIVLWGSSIGFLAVFTSLVVLSSSFQEMFRLDFGVPAGKAWAAGSLIPILLYVLGFQNFIMVIAAVGAIAGGIDALLIIYTHGRMHTRRGTQAPRFSYLWKWALGILFVVGAAQKIYALIAL